MNVNVALFRNHYTYIRLLCAAHLFQLHKKRTFYNEKVTLANEYEERITTKKKTIE